MAKVKILVQYLRSFEIFKMEIYLLIFYFISSSTSLFGAQQVILSTNIAESSVTVPDVKYGKVHLADLHINYGFLWPLCLLRTHLPPHKLISSLRLQRSRVMWVPQSSLGCATSLGAEVSSGCGGLWEQSVVGALVEFCDWREVGVREEPT